VFSCILPDYRRKSITIRIKQEHCQHIQTISNYLTVHYSSNLLYLGVIAQFSCSPGYRLSNYRSLICLEGERWSQFPPKCLPLQCPPLAIQDPNLSCSVSTNKFGGTARCFCRERFTLIGEGSLHCRQNGRWSNLLPICRAITCGSPPLPNHASFIQPRPKTLNSSNRTVISSQHFSSGQVAIYTCKVGYLLTGSDFTVCQQNGQWSKLLTKCENFCYFPGSIEFGNTTSVPKTYYTPGEKLIYYCTNGYKLDAENVITCLKGSKWSLVKPKCVKQ